jgi:hypothetical protein
LHAFGKKTDGILQKAEIMDNKRLRRVFSDKYGVDLKKSLQLTGKRTAFVSTDNKISKRHKINLRCKILELQDFYNAANLDYAWEELFVVLSFLFEDYKTNKITNFDFYRYVDTVLHSFGTHTTS